MVGTVLLILFGLVFIAGVVGFFATKEPGAVGIAGIAGILFIITAAVACTTVVGTRQVGIVTRWNKPTGEVLNNGLHFIAPWTDVHEMDAAIQNDVFNGQHRIQVRLGNNSTAQADANIRWQIKSEDASDLFVQYKTFDGVRSNLVERNLRVALNEAFASYDPLAVKNLESSPLPAISTHALELLRAKVGNQIEIIDVSVPTIDYDEQTEQRINAINQARADTTKAEQDAKTAVQKRAAAEELAKMPAPDLRIGVAACLNKMAESGANLACWPIGSGVLPTLSVPSALPGH